MYHGYLQHYGVYSPFRYMYYLLLIPWVRVLTHSWHCGSYICRFISLKLLPFPLLYFTALINSFSSYLISEPIFSGSILLSAVQSSSLSILLTPILILAFSAPQFRSISAYFCWYAIHISSGKIPSILILSKSPPSFRVDSVLFRIESHRLYSLSVQMSSDLIHIV